MHADHFLVAMHVDLLVATCTYACIAIVFTSSLFSITLNGVEVASFPGLPRARFFCSSVCVDSNTRMRKGGEKRLSPPFRIRVLLSCQRKPKNRKKRGRPGNEARLAGEERPILMGHIWT